MRLKYVPTLKSCYEKINDAVFSMDAVSDTLYESLLSCKNLLFGTIGAYSKNKNFIKTNVLSDLFSYKKISFVFWS